MFKIKYFLFFIVTFLFSINMVYSVVWSENSNCEYQGIESSASSFSCSYFTSNFNILVEINSQINLTDMDSNSIYFDDGIFYFNHTQFDARSATFNYWNLFSNKYSPIYFRNNISFTPTLSFFDNLTYTANFTNTVNNLENYQISKNSRLNVFPIQQPYFNTTVDFNVSFENVAIDTEISVKTCSYIYNSVLTPIVSDTFSILFDSQIEVFSVTCNSTNYETITSSEQYNTLQQPVDDFLINLSFNEYLSSPTVFVDKNLSINIISNGINNLLAQWTTKYYIGLSWDEATQDTTDLLYNNWFDIGKNENLNIFASSDEEITYTDISGLNYSNFLFRNEKDGQGQDKSLILNVKACSLDWLGNENCKYNYSNYFVFKDLTPPNITKSINGGFLNDSNNIIFDYTVYDFESNINSLKYSIIENGSVLVEPSNSILGFTSNAKNTFTATNQNLSNGKYYQFIFKAENGVSIESSNIFSDLFLIDTISPVNSTFNLTLNNYDFIVGNSTNIDLNPGLDYDINYSVLELFESGLNNTKLVITKHVLLNNNCLGFVVNITNYYYDTSIRTENFEVETGYCYEVEYFVYDKAGNENGVTSINQIRVDTTLPTIVGMVEDNSNLQNFGFDENKVIFRTNWEFLDLESGILFYDAYLYKQSENISKFLVQNFTNLTSPYLDVRYNISYIEDGAEYFVDVKATNRANLSTSLYGTNGITLIEQVAPEIEIINNIYTQSNLDIFDFINDSITTVVFNDVNNLNITCRYYESDVNYDEFQGTACVKSVDDITCTFTTTGNIVFHNYSISCLNLNQIDNTRNKNNASNNFDLSIYLEYNSFPSITHINSESYDATNLSRTLSQVEYDLFENETQVFTVTAIDENVGNIYYSNYIFDNMKLGSDRLVVSINATTEVGSDLFSFIFNNDSSVQVPILQKNTNDLNFYFNSILNKSKMISLLSDVGINDVLIVGLDNSTFSNFQIVQSNDSIVPVLNTTSIYSYNNTVSISNDLQVSLGNYSDIVMNQILANTFEFTYSPDVGYRNGTKRFDITFTDGIDDKVISFDFNVIPLYYLPVVNLSFLNSVNSSNDELMFEIGENKVIDLSKYFYEENSEVGLNGTLSYEILNSFDEYQIENYDINSPFMNISIIKNDVSNLIINVTNVEGGSIELSLGVLLVDYVVPTIEFTDKDNSSLFNYINLDNSFLEFNINSTKILTNATLKINSENFSVCLSCSFKTVVIESNDLIIGENIAELTFIGGDFVSYVKIQKFNFSFINQTNITNIEDSFMFNIPLKVYVNNSINLSKLILNDLNSTYNIEIKDNVTNNTIVEFEYDFGLDNLSLVGIKVLYEERVDRSSIIVGNLILQTSSQSKTKTALIKAPSNKVVYDSVCIRDEELDSITQISEFCNGSNEYVVVCDGSIVSGLACNYNLSLDDYVVSGLRHSGVVVFDSTTYVDPSVSSGGSGSSGGGSSGGSGGGGGGGSGGSSGGSGNSYVYEVVNESIFEIADQIIGIEFELNKENILELNFSNKFNLDFYGEIIYGEFFKSTGKLEFLDIDNKTLFEVTTTVNYFDLDNDGFDESVIYYTVEDSNYFLSYKLLQKPEEKIEFVPEVTEPEVNKVEVEIPIGTETYTGSSFINIFFIFILCLLVLICCACAVYYFYFYHNKNSNKNVGKDYVISSDLNNVIPNKAVVVNSYLLEKLKKDHNILLLKLELDKLNVDGISWTQMYIYLKSQDINKVQLSYLFTFDTLIKQIENFCNKNKATFNIQNKIRNEKWIMNCFFYEKPMEKIVRDIAFMITGVNIYGFKAERFQEFFIEEMEIGLLTEKLSDVQKDYLDKEIKEKLFQFE